MNSLSITLTGIWESDIEEKGLAARWAAGQGNGALVCHLVQLPAQLLDFILRKPHTLLR